ncbi:MAG TPA: glycosyltransferase family 4 protein, partial [Sumerlaeia bacterium]|nr:glycosyltransferase family 4 protein [Sumerlaeia bacterium]
LGVALRTTDEGSSRHFMPPPYRAVILLESLKRGGVQQGVLQLAPRLDKTKYALQVWALRSSGANWELAGDFENAGIPVKSVPVRHLADRRGVIALARRLESERVCLLNPRSLFPAIAGGLAARLARTPVLIAGYHGTYAHRWTDKTILYQRMLAETTDAFVCVSQAVKRHIQPLLALPEEKVRVLLNGLDIDRFAAMTDRKQLRARLGLPESGAVVASIGRLTKTKDVGAFIEAIPAIRKVFPNAIGLIVGDGEERAALEKQTASMGLQEAVRFLGSRSDAPEILNAVDCVALTSRVEGMPRTLLEAFAARTPVVSTPAGGVPEILRDGENGLLVPFSNPERLAQAVIETLEDPDAAGRRAEQAFRDVQPHGLETWVRGTEAIFDEALKERRGTVDAYRDGAEGRSVFSLVVSTHLRYWRFRFLFRTLRVRGRLKQRISRTEAIADGDHSDDEGHPGGGGHL